MDKSLKVEYTLQLRKGKGTFSRKDIKRGERIIQDRPILRFGAYRDPHQIYSQFLRLNPKSRKTILDLSCRRSQEHHYLSRINKHDLGRVWALCGEKLPSGIVPTKEEAAKVLAVFDNNQVQLQYQSPPELSLKIARINHSCVPNVAVAWNSKLEMYTVHAIQDIKMGEEILYSYVYLPEPREHRQEQLRRWKIECKCSACAFENVSMEEQKQNLIENDKKDVSRPKLNRRSTAELNVMLYRQPTAQSSENRRWGWKSRNESINKTIEDREMIGRVPTYEAMIDFLGPEEEFLEERVRLFRKIIREYEYEDDIRDRDSDDVKVAFDKAIDFATTAYGNDGDATMELHSLAEKNLPKL